jgi:hypothetical protein
MVFLKTYPPEVNCFMVRTPLSVKLTYANEIDDFSTFIHSWRHSKYVIYNKKEEMEYSKIAKIIHENLWQLLIPIQKTFKFNTVTIMRDFIIKIQHKVVVEVIWMHNMFHICLVANLYELFGSEPIRKIDLDHLKPIYTKLKSLILTNWDSLKLFQFLSEKTITDNKPAKLTISRKEIPNFCKNINVVFSQQFLDTVVKKFKDKVKESNVFRNESIKFHLEVEEADEVYAYKRRKTHNILSKLLNNVELKKVDSSWVNYYSPVNRRNLSEFERECMNGLIYSKEYHYWWIDFLSSCLFFQRSEQFKKHFQENEFGSDYSFKFPEWGQQIKSIFNKWGKLIASKLHKFVRYKKWSHWNKNHDSSSEQVYRTRRQRFKEVDLIAEKIINNPENSEYLGFMEDVWCNHKMPKVFVNMKREAGDTNAQNMLVEMFDQRKLDISYSIFIEYFKDSKIISKFFSEEDYIIDEENESITISNCLMIPVLGILKMMDDYKRNEVKEGWELCPYATHSDPNNEKPYTQIQRNQIREGECDELFKCDFIFTTYDKNYELKNWNAYLTYNGVKYFYHVQDKSSLISELKWSGYFETFTHRMYKFLYSSNPVDLIFATVK